MSPLSLVRPRAGRPSPVRLHLTALEDRANPVDLGTGVPIATDPSMTPSLNVDPSMAVDLLGRILVVSTVTGQDRFRADPFPGFDGPIGTAVGDLTGDGVTDVAVAAGLGGGPVVKAYDGRDGRLINSFFAYDPSYRGGVDIDVGDLDGNGVAEIVTGTGPGGGAHVRAFRADTGAETLGFFAFEPAFRGGVDVAVMDANGDGRAEIMTAAGATGGPRVIMFDAQTRAQVASFFAFDPGLTSGVILRSIGQTDGSVLLEMTPAVPDGVDPLTLPLARLADMSGFFPAVEDDAGGPFVG
jgi:hypothetical protein